MDANGEGHVVIIDGGGADRGDVVPSLKSDGGGVDGFDVDALRASALPGKSYKVVGCFNRFFDESVYGGVGDKFVADDAYAHIFWQVDVDVFLVVGSHVEDSVSCDEEVAEGVVDLLCSVSGVDVAEGEEGEDDKESYNERGEHHVFHGKLTVAVHGLQKEVWAYKSMVILRRGRILGAWRVAGGW